MSVDQLLIERVRKDRIPKKKKNQEKTPVELLEIELDKKIALITKQTDPLKFAR